ncbi:MAG TPA: NAD-dependent epimerase/dehydratase family protein [Steroidobacteraceae bacterium]|nr:NAD-dependent epimerase/dehydratase family protein [Steroidobacteraceae bacterium]
MIFGATGMVGQGVLRECLLASDVERVLIVGRTASGIAHVKLRELRVPDLTDYSAVEADLSGFDACFFCLGVSSAGLSEAQYTRITYDLTLAAAEVLARLNPQMTFVYVSGVGTDSSERGSIMWARVKGRTENALRRLPFKASYMFRPGVIQPMHGARSKTRVYAVTYLLAGWLLPLLRAMSPRRVLTTESVGRAMLAVARRGAPQVVLEPGDIYDAARGA